MIREEVEYLMQRLRTVSLTYASDHFNYIQSLKNGNSDLVSENRMKMVKSYKKLDSITKKIKMGLLEKVETTTPESLDDSWGSLLETLASASKERM